MPQSYGIIFKYTNLLQICQTSLAIVAVLVGNHFLCGIVYLDHITVV